MVRRFAGRTRAGTARTLSRVTGDCRQPCGASRLRVLAAHQFAYA
jgi:hypothetical protein